MRVTINGREATIITNIIKLGKRQYLCQFDDGDAQWLTALELAVHLNIED
jgi:hypothetical protein